MRTGCAAHSWCSSSRAGTRPGPAGRPHGGAVMQAGGRPPRPEAGRPPARRPDRDSRPPGRLHGRAGLITGAASGIGAAGAELFAAQGAALVLVDVDAAAGQRVADAICARQGQAVFCPGDAASADDVSRAVGLAVAEFGKLDLLWANAATGVTKT